MNQSAIFQPEQDRYVSLCPELNMASQGDTIEEAKSNLQEALDFFLSAP